MQRYLWAILLVWAAGGCTHKPDANAGLNQAPVALLSVKEITLSDSTHLVSKVHLYWTASDADGFIKGFRISVQNAAYTGLIKKTDSTFSFNLPAGSLTANISVRVVAIDNSGNTSPPAELILPVRNSPPVAAFNYSFMPKLDTALLVLSLPFLASDPDGNNTLDSVFLRANGGPWFSMAPSTSSVILVLSEPGSLGVQRAIVYASPKLNTAYVRLPKTLAGISVGGPNTFELKARDLASAESPIVQVMLAGQPKPFFFKPKTSDLLVLDAHPGTNPAPEVIYNPVLAAAYPEGYDKIDLTIAGGKNQQRQFVSTLGYLLSFYQKVFWYSDNSKTQNFSGATLSLNREDSSSLLSETAAKVFNTYTSQAGNHLLFSTTFPDGSGRLTSSSPLIGWLPIDSMLYSSANARLSRGLVVKNNVAVVGSDSVRYPNLRTLTRAQDGIILTGVDPFYPNSQCDSIYSAQISFTTNPPWPTTSHAVGGRFPKGSAKPSLIFFTVELNRLAGDTSTLQTKPEFTEFFRTVLTRDFAN